MKKKNAFSLVELLVAMAIIAVLIAIAAYGIAIVQRNSRNTKRRKIDENIEIAINDVQASTLKPAGWIGYDSALKKIVIRHSQYEPNLNQVDVQGFNIVEIISDINCSSQNNSYGYGMDETDSTRLWICFNPTSFDHGVRLEKKGIGEILAQLTTSNVSNYSFHSNYCQNRAFCKDSQYGDWAKTGNDLTTWWGQTTLSYNLPVAQKGDYNIAVEVKNNGTPPVNYSYNVEVFVDGISKGTMTIPADKDKYNIGSIPVSNVSSGNHDIQIKWLNDSCPACQGTGIGDANIQVKSVMLTK